MSSFKNVFSDSFKNSPRIFFSKMSMALTLQVPPILLPNPFWFVQDFFLKNPAEFFQRFLQKMYLCVQLPQAFWRHFYMDFFQIFSMDSIKKSSRVSFKYLSWGFLKKTFSEHSKKNFQTILQNYYFLSKLLPEVLQNLYIVQGFL